MQVQIRETMTRVEVAKAFGITTRALRYYEYLELVSPCQRGGQCLYGRREIARIKLIQRGKRFGMSLEELRQWMNLYDALGEAEQINAWREIAARKEADLIARIADLEAALHDLRSLNAALPSLPSTGAPSRRRASGPLAVQASSA